MAFLVTEPDCHITVNMWFTVTIFHERGGIFWCYLRIAAGAEVLSAAFKSILGHEGLVLFEPADEVPPQTQPQLYVTSPVPALPLESLSAGASPPHP